MAFTMTNPDDVAQDAQAQAQAWLVRLRSGRLTPDDLQAFRRWCEAHPQMAQRLRETWSMLRIAAADVAQEEADAARARQRAGGRLHVLRPGRRAFVGFAVAAGASWLAWRPPFQLWPAVGDLAADYRTGTGEQRRVALAADVTVEMNTQTSINVLAAGSRPDAAHGIELLAGEAEVVAGASAPAASAPVAAPREILVVAGAGRMRAQTARFDVRATGSQVCVTCMAGEVAFEHPRRHLTLSAAQQLIYDDRRLRLVSNVDSSAVTAWRRGLLVFNGVPLSQVVDEINRYRPGKVILHNAALGDNRVQAQFPVAKLDDVVNMLGKVYGAKVTKLPGNIVLLG